MWSSTQSIRAQLDQLVSEADSYIGLWKKYQYIEREHLARRAREVGWLEYTNFKPLPSGLWRFEAKDTDALGRFRDKLATSGQEEIQADAAVPKLLLEGAADDKDDNSKRSKRVAVGTVERIRLDRTVVLMRPLDEDSDTLPPARGVLFAALQGDQKRLMRREHAVRRIRSADARMPQLGLLLEGHPTPIRRTDKVRALTPAARKIFDHDPTPEQRQAIDMALNTPDIVVIQGPPGTGKTKVISAIEARLAELEEERPEIAGRTLLTSYQHDAVDNAVSRSLIFGLPPMRFGGRRGVRGADQQTQRWSAGAHEHVSAKLAELPPSRPAALYRRVRDRVATYASGHLPHAELKELLDELVALPTGTLPTELWERLRALAGTPQAGPRDLGLEHSLMVKAARGLRTEAPAFEDDGPRKARQALKLLTSLLTDDERSLLEEAAGVDPGASFRRQDELAPLRDAIIDRLNPDIVPGEGLKRLRPDVLDALNAAVAALHEQMRHDGPGAIADTLEEYAEALRKDPAGIKRLLSQYAAVYAATCQQAVGHQVMVAKGGESAQIEFDNVIVDEAARANPLDLFIPMSLAKRRIILVGDHRQLPHLLDPDVERAISGTVRDQEQHALKESLFERLFVGLPHLSVNDAHLRVITLADQFRMHPTLGQFVSDVFYEPHGEGFRSPRPASDFVHRIPGYLRADRPVCAAWQTIDHRQGPERSGKSKSRPSEARWIAREVRRLLVDEGVEANNIGIISFYRAQVDVLLEALVAEDIAERDPDSGLIDIQPRWQTIERQDGKREERLRVGTVDAFQGKEFDVVFLSITRSNTLPAETEDHRRAKYGHLMLANRLCVAMSRQRKLLVAVGDRAMFNTEQAREAVPGLAHFLTLCGGEDGLVT